MSAISRIFFALISLFLLAANARAIVAAPTLNPVEGDVLVRFNLALNCSTAGAEIHYTRNGAEPTLADPWVASGGTVSITADCVIKAKAFASGESSTTTSGTYLLTGDVSAGGSQSFGLSTSGKVWGWGQQQYGRLANGLSASAIVSSPAQAKYSSTVLFEDASMVASGLLHTVFLKNTGDVYASGRNNRGAVGNNTTTDALYPVRVVKSTTSTDYLTSCIAVEAGDEFSLALGSNGKVYAWGDREFRKLGDNDPDSYRTYALPVTTDASGNPDLTGIVSISASRYSSVAREANALESGGALGRVWGWGRNTDKQIGAGSSDNKGRASLILLNSTTALADAWDASCGGRHTAIVRWKSGDSSLQGSVWCVGNQQYGRLGNNLTSDSTVSYPVQVMKSGSVPLTGIIAVSTSPVHTLALEQPAAGQVGGKVWSWGYNGSGELGDGSSTANRSYAATVKTLNASSVVVDLDNIIKVSAGGDGSTHFSIAIAADGSVYTWGANASGQLGLGSTSTATPWLAKKIPNLKLKVSPPSVTLSAPLPSPNRPGVNMTLTASPADADGLADIVKVEFFNGSSLLGQSTASPWTYAYNSLTAGSYSVKAVVTDAAGLTGESAAIPFTILSNTAPTVTLAAGVTTSIAPGAVTLTASPADANGTGDIVKVGFYDGTTLLEEKTSAPWTSSRTALSAGSYAFSAKVTDAAGLIGTSATQNVTITVPAYAPTVSLVTEMPAVNLSGAAVLLKATPTDQNGAADIAKVQFFNGATLLSEVTSAPWNFNYTGLAAGSYAVKAVVTDAGGLTGQSSVANFTILPATAPVVSLSSAVTTAQAPGAVMLTAAPTDANGTADISKVEFYSGTNKIGEATSAPWTYHWTNLAAGNYQVRTVVTDLESLGGESTPVNFTINLPPLAPSVSLVTVLPSLNVPGASVALNATPTDPNGAADIVKVEFFNGTTLIGQSTAAPWSFNYPNLSAGSYSVKAIVTDAAGLTAQSDVIPFTIHPLTAPQTGLAATVTVIQTPGAVTLAATPTDVNGVSNLVKVEFYEGTTLLGQATAAPWKLFLSGLAARSYQVRAVATDAQAMTGQSANVNFVIDPQSPVAPQVTLSANVVSPATPGMVVLSAVPTDVNGITDIAKVEFFNSTGKIGETAAAPWELPVSGLGAGTYSYTAKAIDQGDLVGVSSAVQVTIILDADGDGIPDGTDAFPTDYFNGNQPVLQVFTNTSVKVIDAAGNPVAGVPVKFSRITGTGSFPGGGTTLTRQTNTQGVISISDYTLAGNDLIKASLTSAKGTQSVWLPPGITDPTYGNWSGGGVFSFMNPPNTPYWEPNDPQGDPEIVMPIQNYLKYHWKVISGKVPLIDIDSDPDNGRVYKTYKKNAQDEWVFDSSLITESIFQLNRFEDFNILSFPSEFLWDTRIHEPLTVEASLQLLNLPKNNSKIEIQKRAANTDGRPGFGSQGWASAPLEIVELTSASHQLDYSVHGNIYAAGYAIGPFISGVTWEELDDSSISVGTQGERVITCQALYNYPSEYDTSTADWIILNHTWNIDSDNSDIDVQFVTPFGGDVIELGKKTVYLGTAGDCDIRVRHLGFSPNSEANITLDLRDSNGVTIISKVIHVVISSEAHDKPVIITSSMTSDEATSPKYRKIGLTGVPLSDEKPQASEESDEENEETYVDALTRELRHSTTDVYVPVPASQLALSVRRNAASEIWSYGSGLAPSEDPTLAFGAGWRSNLSANIRIIEQTDAAGNLVALMSYSQRKAGKVGQSDPNYAIVTDEDGSSYRFAIGYGSSFFVPMPTSRNEQDAFQVSLQLIGGDLVFKRKFGNELHFGSNPSIQFSLTSNRIAGSRQYQAHKYYRLNAVKDRFGNQLNYTYEGAGLVPKQISVKDHPELVLKIQQDTAGRITKVYDPNGNETTYCYGASSISGSHVMESVYCGGVKVSDYAYQERSESDYRISALGSTGISILPWDRRNSSAHQYQVGTGHIDLLSITGAYGQTVSFEYDFDVNHRISTNEATYNAAGDPSGRFVGSYTLSGFPMDVKKIHLSGARVVQITGTGFGTTVVDASGNQRSYQWDDIRSVPVPQSSLGYAYSDTSVTTAVNHFARKMTITDQEGKKEIYEFDVNAGCALAKVTDYSGNITTYSHGKALDGTDLATSAWGGGIDVLKSSDPTSQTDALSRTTRYAYGAYRVMTTVIDPSGNRTDNQVDDKGRRTQETVKDSSGNILKQTDFAYHSNTVGSGFPNFLTRQTVKNVGLFASSDPSWVGEMTTLYEPDSNGRLQREAIDMNGNKAIDTGDLITSYTYDRSGNKLTTTSPDGLTTWFNYDTRHRLVSVIYPDGSHKDTVYDKSGKKVLVRDENGHASGFVYDDGGRLIKTVRDMNGNLTANVSAGSVATILSGIDTGVDQVELNGYNNIDLPVQKTDARGYVSVTEYDYLRRPTRTIAPGPSRGTGTVPDGSGDDLVTRMFYDGPNSGASSFDVSGFKPTRVVDARGYTTVNVYDALYRNIETRTQYSLSPAQYARAVNVYDQATGTLTDTYAYRDPYSQSGSALGSQQRFSRTHTDYDKLQRPAVAYQAYGTALQSSTGTAYTSTGLAHRVTQQLEAAKFAITDTAYDAAGRAISVTGPEVPIFGGGLVRPVSQTLYTPAGLKTAVIDARNFRTDFRYDARGRLIQTVSPPAYNGESQQTFRAITSTTYDAVGNVVSATDARGYTSDTVYDAANRATDVYSPEVEFGDNMEFVRPHTQTIYDLAGNVLKLIDPNGNATVNTYDSLGRLKTTKTNPTVVASNTPHADDIVVQNEYDAGSNLVQVTDGLGQATRFTFDGLKRSTSTIWDYGTTRAKTLITEYDALVTTAAVDSRNWRTEFSYDERFRQVASTCASRPDDNETRSYDLADRLRSVNRASSTDLRNVSYLYDDAGRTTQETSTGQTTISEYDESGNRRCVTYPLGGRQLVTSFDALNRVTTIVETKPGVTGSRTTSYFYDASGNRVLCTKPHGGSETTSYDALSRKVSLTTNSGIASTISSTIYIYDLGSNLISISEANNAVPDRSIENIYDRVYRLKQETTVTGANDKTEVAAFTYDKANNRTGRTRTTVVPGSPTTVYSDTFTYGSAANGGNSNQLMLFHDGKRFVDVSYTYDANGNRQQRLEGSSATHTYVWDNRNRLIEVTSPDGTSHYGYDYRTRRVLRDESSAGGTSDVITFSGGTSIFERVINTTVPTVEYIRGSDWGGGIGGILYTERGGDITHNAYNSRGDVIAKTNSQGTITWQASYEAFGTRTEETGTNADRQRANTKEEDPTGLLNEGFRYRDLETGLFISRDPAGFVDGPNVYTYVKQNPWSGFDPEGLSLKGFFVGLWEGMIMRELDRAVGNADVGFTMAPLLLSPEGGQKVQEQRDNFVQKVDDAQVQMQVDNSKDFNIAANDAHRPAGQKVGALIDDNIDIVAASGFAVGNKVLRRSSPASQKETVEYQQEQVEQQEGGQPTKYGNVPDPKNVGEGKEFTRTTKKKILEQNKLANGGVIKSDKSGVEAVPSQQSQSGVTPPSNEAQIDHIVPKSKGGSNSPSNAQVLTREENRAKSNN